MPSFRSKKVQQKVPVPEKACPTEIPPLPNYTQRGRNITTYIAGERHVSKNKGIVIIPDIFGLHPHVYRLADNLADHGFTVVLPDFFPNGSHWPYERVPIDKESDQWKAFVSRTMIYTEPAMDILHREGIGALKLRGINNIGLLAMCWGSKLALQAFKEDGNNEELKCVVCPHPYRITAEDVKNLKGPIAMLMPKGDASNVNGIQEALERDPRWKEKNVFVRFVDLAHGFLGGHGPLDKAFAVDIPDDIAQTVTEAFTMSVNFFKFNLSDQS